MCYQFHDASSLLRFISVQLCARRLIDGNSMNRLHFNIIVFQTIYPRCGYYFCPTNCNSYEPGGKRRGSSGQQKANRNRQGSDVERYSFVDYRHFMARLSLFRDWERMLRSKIMSFKQLVIHSYMGTLPDLGDDVLLEQSRVLILRTECRRRKWLTFSRPQSLLVLTSLKPQRHIYDDVAFAVSEEHGLTAVENTISDTSTK